MKFSIAKKSRRPLMEWHLWFAWFPIRAGDKIVWLEKVMRRGGYDHSKNRSHGAAPWCWEYATKAAVA